MLYMAAANDIDKMNEDLPDSVEDQEIPPSSDHSLREDVGRRLDHSEPTESLRKESNKQSVIPAIEKGRISAALLKKNREQDAYGSSAAFTVGKRPSPSHSQASIKSPWMKYAPEKPARHRVLEELIIARKETVAQLERRCQTLAQTNADLIVSIEALEARSADEASTLLQQYERFETNIEAVQAWSQRQVNEAREKLRQIRERGTNRLKALELQLLDLNAELKAAQDEVHSLRNYRDKEYPVHVLRIAELKREFCKQQEAYEDEKEHVEALADSEMEKLSLVVESLKVGTMEKIAEKASASDRPLKIKQLSHCNAAMAREVLVLQQAAEDMQTEIASLEKKHAELLVASSHQRQKIFPEVLLQRPKCPPDMDIVLDIPVERPIPI